MMNILPEFESRQVLTSDELNWLTSYLDSQNRLSRKILLGCGVIGGLQIKLNTNPTSIKLTNGCALTSAGHIVSLQNERDSTTFNKIKKYTQKEKERLAFPYLSDDKEGEQDYSNSVNNPSIYFNEFKDDVYELFEDTYNDADQLEAKDVNGKVAIAFAEIIQTELKDCEEDNCKDKGKKYTFKTKILLIGKEDAIRLLNIQLKLVSEEEDISKKAFPWLYIPTINVLKPVFSNLNFTKGINEAVLIQEYKRCINHLAQTIETNSAAINNGLNNLKNFISVEEKAISFAESLLQLIKKLNNRVDNQKIYVAQVSYDYLWTIIKAYQEIQQTAQGLRAKCMLEGSAFPNHVLLGELKASTGNWEAMITHSEDIYRHPFYSQYTQTEQALVCRKIGFLFNRLDALLGNFDDDIFNKVKIARLSPGASLYEPLSLQSIPYYLKSEITNNWNQNADHPYLKRNITYYNYSDAGNKESANIYNQQPLSFQGTSSFFRIEGVQGQKALDALNDVFKIRKTYGLPYEVIMLRLNEDAPGNHSFNFSVNEDIESIYQVVRAELSKQINLNLSYIGGLLFKHGKFKEIKTSLDELLTRYYQNDRYRIEINQLPYYGSSGLATARLQNEKAFANLRYQATLLSHQQTSQINVGLLNMDFLLPIWMLTEDSFGNLIDSIKKEEKFKNESELSFYTHLLAISKSEVKGKELFYKTLRLYSALRLQELSLTENFLEFDINVYSKNLNEELLKACDSIISYLKKVNSDFIKNDGILTEVVKGEMLDYADRIKFDDDWVKMNQIDAENKKRNGGLGLENLLERFLHFHPGITHGCGVPKGGTFIMVYDKGNEVTADFYLPYIISSTLRPIQYTLLEAKTITLSGLITDTNKKPVEGARVTVQGNTVLSNNDGGYSSIVDANETIQVTVSAEGYAEIEEDISIEGASKEYDFVLKEIEIKHTTTVRFIDENKKRITADISLIGDIAERLVKGIPLKRTSKKGLVAKLGVLEVSGTPKQEFNYSVNEQGFDKKTFTVKIEDKDKTQDVTLSAVKK